MGQASLSTASQAAQRYASALFELAQDKGELADIQRAFAGFAGLIRESADLARLVASPAFSREQKTAALTDVARAAGLPDLLVKFVGTIAENGRARDLPGAQRAFDELYARQRGVKRVLARTARPMTEAQRQRVEAILAKSVGGEVDLSEEVDDSLIGGLQLRIGSTLVDASLAAKLERMNTAMKGA